MPDLPCSGCRLRSILPGLIAILATFQLTAGDNELPITGLQLGQVSYQIEIASTSDQRQQGLMHRQQLGLNQGMLLVYPDSGDHRIWMKNMQISLRVYWIDETYRVIDMQQLHPCAYSPCPVYSAPSESRFVLELADSNHALDVGDVIPDLALIKPQ